jgi:hypothetical protein
MLWFKQGLEQRGRLRPSQFVVSHAQICKGLSHRSRHSSTTCATMFFVRVGSLTVRVIGSEPLASIGTGCLPLQSVMARSDL